jgi:prophage tail gpP-like protein
VTLPQDNIVAVVDGREFDRFASYDVQVGVFDAPGEFAFELGKVDAATRAWLEKGAPVEIYVMVGGVEHLVITGRIEERVTQVGKGEHGMVVHGFDKAADLQVATAPFDLDVEGRQFIDVVGDLVNPWAIPVTLSNEVNRWLVGNKPKWKKLLKGMTKAEYHAKVKELQRQHPKAAAFKAACKAQGIPVPPHVHSGITNKAKDVKVDPGETVWDWIERVSERAEVWAWMSPDGWLTIQRPQYEQEPAYILSHRPSRPRENNIKSFTERDSLSGVPTELTVHSTVRQKGKKRVPIQSAVASSVAAYAAGAYGLYRPVHMKYPDARNTDECAERAWYAMKEEQRESRSYSVTVAGHSQGGIVWTPDTVAKGVFEVVDVDELLYLHGVRFGRSRIKNSPGPREAQLELHPLDTWQPKAD